MGKDDKGSTTGDRRSNRNFDRREIRQRREGGGGITTELVRDTREAAWSRRWRNTSVKHRFPASDIYIIKTTYAVRNLERIS